MWEAGVLGVPIVAPAASVFDGGVRMHEKDNSARATMSFLRLQRDTAGSTMEH